MKPLILCYHAVSEDWESDLAVTPAQLESVLQSLAKRGYRGVTFSESERLRANGRSTGKCVVVTFDDGFRSVLNARPILERAGFPATIFVVTDFVSTARPFEWEGVKHWTESHRHELQSLSWEECRELQSAGWEIGSHTASHPVLPLVDEARRVDELQRSRAAIEAALGGCSSLAYPYGQADRRTADEAARAGYTAACTLSFVQRPDEPLLRPRVGLVRGDSRRRATVKVHPLVNAVRRSPVAALLERTGLPGSTRQTFTKDDR